MWLTQDLRIGYKCLINPFSPLNVDIIDSYFYMSFLNVYYITLCRLYEKHLTLSEVKNWQVCYSRVVTLVVVHYNVDLLGCTHGCITTKVINFFTHVSNSVLKSKKVKVDSFLIL
jgi:hypothetical protein